MKHDVTPLHKIIFLSEAEGWSDPAVNGTFVFDNISWIIALEIIILQEEIVQYQLGSEWSGLISDLMEQFETLGSPRIKSKFKLQNEIIKLFPWVLVFEWCDDVPPEAGHEAHPDHSGRAEAEGETKSEIDSSEEWAEQFLDKVD